MRISADIGGTFTDLVAWNSATGSVTFSKAPTTPDDPVRGVTDGLALLAAKLNLTPQDMIAQAERFVHGTTVATNTLAEGSGPLLGLITTQGFRDVLELRDGTKSERYALRTAAPTALIPRNLRLTVAERLLFDGSVDTPLDETAVAHACAQLAAAGVQDLVIAMLHSHVNPVHELRAEEVARKAGWKGSIVLSHKIYNRQGEYARFSTASVNAYVTPRLQAYVRRLQSTLAESRPDFPVLIVQSSGGLVPVEVAATQGVGCVTSGPAGGAIACAFLAQRMGIANAVTYDIGGTTTDISLIEDGRSVEREKTQTDAYVIAVPSIDVRVHAIGGGSIAAVDSGGILGVGPKSSGAFPGPAAYGRGGMKATVTDAAVVLGYFNTGKFTDGRLSLDLELAAQAIRRDIAEPLDLSVQDAALAVYHLAAAKVAEGVRSAVIGRGTDPREIDLIAFGGAGGLYIDTVARELEMTRAIAPRAASVFSAFGFLAGRVRFDEGRTIALPSTQLQPQHLACAFAQMQDKVASQLETAGFTPQAMQFELTLDCRYEKQTGTVEVRPALNAEGTFDMARITEDFETRYEALYAHRHPGQACVIEACRLTGTGQQGVMAFPLAGGHAEPQDALRGHRDVYTESGWAPTPVYDFEALRPGCSVQGPALFESTSTTLVIGQGSVGRIDELGSLIVTRPAQTGGTQP